MTIFHRKYTDAKGTAREQKKWSIEFRDHHDGIRRITGFTDKNATLELERNLNRLVALRLAGSGPDAELSRFLESCPDDVRRKLAEWRIIDAVRAAIGKELNEHVEEWRLALIAKQNSKEYIAETTAKIYRLAKACNWKQISDISDTEFDNWRVAAHKATMSLETANMYLVALRNFCNWLKNKKRITENPVEFLEKWNADVDRRRKRRDYTQDELSRLLAVAKAGAPFHGMTGEARSLLYRAAFSTGLRWGELRSLTRSSFDFDAHTVTILSADAKNEKTETLPIQPDLSADLKVFMQKHKPGDRAFTGMWTGKGAEMLKQDMEVAKIKAVDASGRQADFHAFRHTYGSMLGKMGVPLVMAQRMMRHSDPKLTSNIYTHIWINDAAKELAKLPTIVAATPKRKTGKRKPKGDDAEKAVEKMDSKMDSKPTDQEAKIRTYRDLSEVKKALIHVTQKEAENEKTPVGVSPTGVNSNGGRYWTRTSDPYNVSVVRYQLRQATLFRMRTERIS